MASPQSVPTVRNVFCRSYIPLVKLNEYNVAEDSPLCPTVDRQKLVSRLDEKSNIRCISVYDLLSLCMAACKSKYAILW